MNRMMVRTAIHLTSRQHETIKQEAERLHLTVAEMVRRILDAWVDERESKDKRELIKS